MSVGPFMLNCDGCGCFLGQQGERIEPPCDAKIFAWDARSGLRKSIALPAENAALFSGTREQIETFETEHGWRFDEHGEHFCPPCAEARSFAA